MGKFVYFTSAEKRQGQTGGPPRFPALPSFLLDRGEKLIMAGREYRLVSDHSITVRGPMWYDHAARKGGRAISFVQQFYDKTYPEAVSILLGRDGQGIIPIAKQERQVTQAKEGTGAAGAKALCPAEALLDYAQDVCLSHQAQVH